MEDEASERELKALIERHWRLTQSGRAEHILHQWTTYRSLFWKVVPHPPQVDTESTTARVTSLSGSDAAELQRPVLTHQTAP